MRFAPFKRLPNRTMLWRGGRPSAVASTLRFGLRVPLQEAPSAGYIFGEEEEEDEEDDDEEDE
eukprot:2673981-Rhodomonas_salina.1